MNNSIGQERAFAYTPAASDHPPYNPRRALSAGLTKKRSYPGLSRSARGKLRRRLPPVEPGRRLLPLFCCQGAILPNMSIFAKTMRM